VDELQRAYPNRTDVKRGLKVFPAQGGSPLFLNDPSVNQSLYGDNRFSIVSTSGNYSLLYTPVIGLDLASHPPRRNSLETAVKTASFSLTPPLVVVARNVLRRGVLTVLPVFSTSGLIPNRGNSLIRRGTDVVALAGEIAPGVNRLTADPSLASLHAHNSSDACGEAFRTACAPFTSREEAFRAYNESLTAVANGTRAQPLTACSSRCANGHLLRGHVIVVYYFIALAKEAQLSRNPNSPLALYSEDVTELVQAGMAGANATGIDDNELAVQEQLATMASREGFLALQNSQQFDFSVLGSESIPSGLVDPGYGSFQFAINDDESAELQANSD